jgi:hypothetical protein
MGKKAQDVPTIVHAVPCVACVRCSDFFLGNKQRNSQTKGGLLQTTAFASTDRTLLARDYYFLDDTVLVKLEVNQ